MSKKETKTIADEKIVQIMPAPMGMVAHYAGENNDKQPISNALQVVALALVEIDNTQVVRALTLGDLNAHNGGCSIPDDESGVKLTHITI